MTDIAALRALLERITDDGRPLPWVVHSGSSYRRIASLPTKENGGRSFPDGNVLHAYTQRSDGHPDLSMGEEQLEALVAIVNAWPALLDRVEALEAENATAVEGLNDRARLIVELLAMSKANIGFAGDIHIRRARRIIDGDNDSKAAGEANYRAYCAASPDHVSEGTVEGLATVAHMVDEYAADSLPANEHGQIHFARAMLESAAGEIKAYLAARALLGQADRGAVG